jgi:tetratricopeptide (TPR) repeat protein
MPDTLSTPKGAVFLSYASQDAEAARRICEALRAGGVEVWFDQSELRGGDAWDQSIRRQIKECALFMPIISAHTQERAEGYFRLEWHLAEQRSLLIAKGRPFIVPVNVDGTSDRGALVPDAFLAVQWSRLPGGETPSAFGERVKKLLGAPADETGHRILAAEGPSLSHPVKASRLWIIPAVAGAIACLALAIWQPWRTSGKGAQGSEGTVPPTPAALPEAQQLIQRGRIVWESGDEPNRDKILAADEIYGRALSLDSTDPEALAAAARLEAMMIFLHYDTTKERLDRASSEAARAVSLAPNSFSARRAQACVFGLAVHTPEMLAEAEKVFRSLVPERPDDKSLATEFGIVLRDQGKFDEAEAVFKKAGLERELAWDYFVRKKYREADAVADHILAGGHSRSALLIKAHTEYLGLEDIDAAYASTSQFTPAELQSEEEAVISIVVALGARKPETALRILEAYPQDFLRGGAWGFLPVRYWIGFARELEGDPDAARAQWQIALQLVLDQRSKNPNDLLYILQEALVRSSLGQTEDARHLLKIARDLTAEPDGGGYLSLVVKTRLGDKEEIIAIFETELKGGHDTGSFHANLRYDPWFGSIRHDPRIEKLLRDTLPAGAKPFDETAPAATPALGATKP